MEEEEDAAKKAFNGTAFAQFVFRPRRRQARAVLLALGIPGNDGDSSQGGMDPVNELKAPVAGIQANDMRTKAIETNSQF